MSTLWWALAALAALALLFVCYPFVRRRSSVQESQQEVSESQANVALFREHLEELELQRERGDIDARQLAALKIELERTLLAESAVGSEVTLGTKGRGNWLVWVLVVIMPLAAFGLYRHFGASQDLAIIELLEQTALMRQQGETAKANQLRGDLLGRIGHRLERDPENYYYWVLTARLNTDQQDYMAALNAYRRALPLAPQDITLLQEYLQVALMMAKGKPTEEVNGLVDRILTLSPNNLPVLGLSGRLAFEAGDYQRAIGDWRRVLQSLPAEHESAKLLQAELARARAALGEIDDESFTDPVTVKAQIALAAELTVKPDDTLFVIARRPGQAGPPLAVVRVVVQALPLLVELTDANMMLPGSSFTNVTEVELTARLTSSGIPQAQPGDRQGQVTSVVVNGGTVTDILIDQVID